MKNIYIKLIDNFLSVIGVEDSMGKVVKSTIVIYDDFKNILIAERGKGKGGGWAREGNQPSRNIFIQ